MKLNLKKPDPKISVITACKNRTDALKVSLMSWLNYKEIKEVIIVDWSSDEPINYLTKLDPRVKVVRVDDKKYFNQPQPLNLAASLATSEYIFHLDGDHVFNPYYPGVLNYLPRGKQFFCGQLDVKDVHKWDETTETAYINTQMERDQYSEYLFSYSPFYRYLFGMLYVKKEYFDAVGGYNEALGDCYAYEDDEICQRLELYGLKKKKTKVTTFEFIHLPHSDTKRIENFKGFDTQEEYRKQITNKLEKHYVGKDLEYQVEYAVSEHQTKLNKKMIGKITNYRVENKTKWKITKIDDQNYNAIEEVQEVKQLDIPFIRYISLEESVDRRNELERSFKKYGIKFKSYISKRFHECDDKVTGRYVDSLNEGTKGCAVSHLKMIKDWYDTTDDEYGFFAEDDLSLETVQYWGFTWEQFIDKTPEDADCIQLLTIRDEYSSMKMHKRDWNDWGISAYIVTRDYAKKIIDTYIKDDGYHLEIPGSDVQPLVENLIFCLGDTYTIPLFVENTKFISTFENRDKDVTNGGKNNHKIAAELVLKWWKNVNLYVQTDKENKIVEKTELEMLMENYSLDTENPDHNFELGLYYYKNGHTAPALSYFLRCAERGKNSNPDLTYNALIMGSYCYFKQGTRDHSGRGMLWQAQMFLPERPEAYFLLARFAERQQWWQDCYATCELALRQCNFDLEPLRSDVEYPGKWGILFEKGISAWWWGKVDESRDLLKGILDDYESEMRQDQVDVVLNNIKKIGGEVKPKHNFKYSEDFNWGSLTYEDIITIEREVVHEKVYRFWKDVREGDVVLDVGASVGAYAVSILDQKPEKVYCVEPSKKLMKVLRSNCPSEKIVPINWGIVENEGDLINIFGGKDQDFKGITFKNMINLYSIDHVDYLKIDCEGGEYNIFKDENMDFLLNKVKFMAIEIHLNYKGCREKFKNFRDKYLTQFKNYKVMSCTRQQIEWGKSLDIKKYIFDDSFIDNYKCEFMIYIKN